MATTLAALQAGSSTIKWVALIEGVSTVLSDATESAVQAAMASTDWSASSVIPVFVDLRNSQSIEPGQAFTRMGRCVLRTLDTTDAFGVLVNKRAGGDETTLRSAIDRNDTTIPVKSTTTFANSGTVYIGTERIDYTSKTGGATPSFNDCTRGRFSPFGTAPSGSGGANFGNHHRVATDPLHAALNPTVSQLPRTWIGKRVGVWLHTVDADGTLNSHADAQLVFPGRLVGIADSPDTFTVELELEPLASDWRNTTIGRDLWSGTIASGFYLATGQTFAFEDGKQGSALLEANVLEVVASGASGANQCNAGYYSLSELCETLNTWLSSENVAGRIHGIYNWDSPVTINDGLRTVCRWKIEDASNLICLWRMHMPSALKSCLGIVAAEPGSLGQTSLIYSGNGCSTNVDQTFQGDAVPFTSVVFRPLTPGRAGQEFATEAIRYQVENEHGAFTDQRSLLPASIKESCPEGTEVGLFLLDDKVLMVGNYESNELINCWLAPFQMTADTSAEAVNYIGRRADEPPDPLTIRQVFIFEGSFQHILNTLAYSTGTTGFNHSTYDTLGPGLGLGMPGELMRGEFERSVQNLPGSDLPIAVVIEEATKFSALLSSDLLLRRAFLRWRNEHFEIAQWKTPLVANATLTLSESNKAVPAGDNDNHRMASQETDQFCRPIVKINYCCDFATGRKAQYLKSITIQDPTGVDDAGSGQPSVTLDMRNSFSQLTNTGSALESLIPDYITTMPMFSKPARQIVRSLDQRYFEGYAPGDTALVTDEFARDPLTGQRNIAARAGCLTRVDCNYGGPTPGSDAVRPVSGEVELFFLDTQRGSQYAPSAEVDDTQTNAGYNAATSTITCYAQKYSHSVTYPVKGVNVTYDESADASNFRAGDEVVLVEIDPDDPAAPVTWTRTIDSVNGNDITFTAALSSPAWDSSKLYRLIYAPYTSCQATQLDLAFQADDADEMVQDEEVAYHYSTSDEARTYNRNDGTEPAEFIPALAYGDGKPQDVAMDRALAATLNGYIDYKSAHQAPCLASGQQLFGVFAEWRISYIGPISTGTEHLSTAITRKLIVAPRFHSTDGTEISVRVTLSRSLPVAAPGGTSSSSEGARFVDHYSQATWTTTSTTQALGDDAELSLGVKDLHFGIAFLTIEVNSSKARCPGLGKCIEGPRVVAT